MTCAVRKSVYDALNPTQKALVRWTCAALQLGSPAVYLNGSAVAFYVFDDNRLDLRDLAVLGCVAANLAALANRSIPAEGPLLRADVRAYVAARVVWPAAINYTLGGDPYAETLAAQGAPPSIRAASGIPSGWTPQ